TEQSQTRSARRSVPVARQHPERTALTRCALAPSVCGRSAPISDGLMLTYGANDAAVASTGLRDDPRLRRAHRSSARQCSDCSLARRGGIEWGGSPILTREPS